MGELTNEKIKEVIDHASLYNDLYNNTEFDTISLIEDLRLSENIHETAHSRILCKLLRAGKSQGFPFLKLFLKKIGFPKIPDNLSDASFYLEKEYIDILITFGGKAIFIENKVNYAAAQNRQIKRYFETLRKGLRLKGEVVRFADDDIYCYYLPQRENDDDPPKESIDTDELKKLKKKKQYKKISFEKEIKEWLQECKKCKELTDGIVSALTQYAEFINNMFTPKYEDMKMNIKNIDEALDITEKNLGDKINEVDKVRKLIDQLNEAINDYAREAFVIELKEKCEKKYNINPRRTPHGKESYKYKVDFCVEYKGNKYTGVANVFPDEDGGYWFGLWEKDIKKPFYINKETIKKATKCTEIKDIGEDNIYDTCFRTTKEGYFRYWKYCDREKGIENMIKEIIHYVKVLREA